MDVWTQENIAKTLPHAFDVRHHPAELVLRVLLSSAYSTLYEPIRSGMTVLEIGTFHTNNLVPFHDRGCVCHGVEINDSMLKIAQAGATRHGQDVHLSLGTNRAIPYENDVFDLLLSVNTIHYEQSLEDLGHAMAEFSRVLKPGGRALVVTVGPEHFIQETGVRLDAHRFRVTEKALREGTILTTFNDEDNLKRIAQPHFSKTETGRVLERYPSRKLDFLFGVLQK